LKPGVRKNAVHTLFAGKGEGAWIFGARSRQRWNMFKRGVQRHLKPRVFIELAPTGEGEASAWLQRRAQIGKSASRLREKHDAKARKKEIESGRIEPVGRRVGAYEFDRSESIERRPDNFVGIGQLGD